MAVQNASHSQADVTGVPCYNLQTGLSSDVLCTVPTSCCQQPQTSQLPWCLPLQRPAWRPRARSWRRPALRRLGCAPGLRRPCHRSADDKLCCGPANLCQAGRQDISRAIGPRQRCPRCSIISSMFARSPSKQTCQSAPPGSWASRSRVLQSDASLSWNRSRSSSRVNLVPPCIAGCQVMKRCAAPGHNAIQSNAAQVWALAHVRFYTYIIQLERCQAGKHRVDTMYSGSLLGSHCLAPACCPAPQPPARASSAAAGRSSRRSCLQQAQQSQSLTAQAACWFRGNTIIGDGDSRTGGQQAVDGAGLLLAVPPDTCHCLQDGTATLDADMSAAH